MAERRDGAMVPELEASAYERPVPPPVERPNALLGRWPWQSGVVASAADDGVGVVVQVEVTCQRDTALVTCLDACGARVAHFECRASSVLDAWTQALAFVEGRFQR